MDNSSRVVRVISAAEVNNYLANYEKARQANVKLKDAGDDALAAYERQNQAMEKVGTKLVAVGAIAAAATALSVKSAIDWESAWAGVTKTVDGTDEEMSALEDQLRSLTGVLPATHEEIAGVAEAAGQLGVKRQDIAAFTKTMIDLSETTNLSADEAATSIAQLMNVMQTAPEDVGRLGATLVALGNDGASTERDIIQMAQRISGAGKLVGATEGEVLGLANALASMGITAELGGGVASRVLQDLYSAVQTGGDQLAAFAKVAGLTSQQFAEQFRADPVRALDVFAKGLNNVEASGGNVVQTLVDLGLRSTEEQRVLLQLKGAGDLLTDSLDLQATAWEANTALVAEANKGYETTEAKLQIAANAARDAAIDYGSVFLPAVAAVAEAVATLSTGFSNLPEPLQGTVAVLGTVAGVAALAGGAFLLAVPKIAEFNAALAVLRASEMPGVARAADLATAGIGRTAGALRATAAFLTGPWGLAIAAAGIGINELSKYMESLQASTEQMKNAAVTASSAEEILTKAFQGIATGYSFDDGARSIAEFNKNLQEIGRYRENIFAGFTNGPGAGSLQQALQNVNDVLGPLAKENLPQAARAFDLLASKTDGSEESLRILLNELPAYRDALTEIATEQGINVSAMTDAERAQVLLRIATEKTAGANTEGADSLDRITGATEAAKQANEEYITGLANADSSFIGFGDALTRMQDKQREWAEDTAEKTEDSSDSWEDYYDGFSVNLADYITELQAQIDAQSAWEQNMILLAGRASEGVISELASLGPEGAPLVAELVNASDEQLAVLEKAFGERSKTGTDNFTNTLTTAAPVIAQAAAQLGQGAVNEIAAKLASGEATVEQIMRDYKLKVEENPPRFFVDTSPAERAMENFFTLFDGREIVVPARGSANWTGSGLATGGIVPGAPSDTDNVLYALATGEFVTRSRVVANPRNRAWLEHMNAGGEMPPLRGYARGGYVDRQPQYALGYSSAPANVSVTTTSAPFEGPVVFMLEDGTPLRGYVQAQAASVVKGSSMRTPGRR